MSKRYPYTFRKELQGLLNKYSLENCSNTPDFTLAYFLISCLRAYDDAVTERDELANADPPPPAIDAESALTHTDP